MWHLCYDNEIFLQIAGQGSEWAVSAGRWEEVCRVCHQPPGQAAWLQVILLTTDRLVVVVVVCVCVCVWVGGGGLLCRRVCNPAA